MSQQHNSYNGNTAATKTGVLNKKVTLWKVLVIGGITTAVTAGSALYAGVKMGAKSVIDKVTGNVTEQKPTEAAPAEKKE